MSKAYQNYINGVWKPSSNGETIENRNPANWDEMIGTFPRSTIDDVNEAVAAAKEALKEWRLVPAPERGDVLKKVGDIMVDRKDEISRDMTREMGKVLAETKGDHQEGIDTAYYAASEGRRLFGHNAPSELRNKVNLSFRMPVGVAGIVTPWNFPMAIPTWKIFPALVCGNTVVFKPATDVPLTATTLVEIIAQALEEVGKEKGRKYPKGVINIVHGAGSTVGLGIVEHTDVDLISFTGSSMVGRRINAAGGAQLKRISLELGGKNAQIVMDDGNLENAIEGALWGAFGTTGQRCTATSRLILHESIHDKFLKMLIDRVNKLKLGDGLDPSTDVGPTVNRSQQETVNSYVKVGLDDGATLECGGKIPTANGLDKGWFFEPTVFSGVTRNMRIAREEIFGPVLSVLKAKDLAEAISILNDTEYGLSSSIYTNDVGTAFVAMRDIECGITYINGATIGAEAHMPFGGMKATGNGHREGGWEVYDFYSETKVCYVDFSGTLQRAQIDNY